MHGLLAAVLRVKAGYEGVQFVAVLGVAESLKHLSHQVPASRTVSSLAMSSPDGPVELGVKDPCSSRTVAELKKFRATFFPPLPVLACPVQDRCERGPNTTPISPTAHSMARLLSVKLLKDL
jgi:hypothetical protein